MIKGKIVVCGATGNQGNAVVQALLPHNKIEIIGLTRSVKSEKAKKLAQAGVRVMEADLLDLDSLKKTFAGASAVFGVTQPWNESYTKCNISAELTQGSNIIAAAKSCGVQKLVFSSIISFTNAPIGVKHADSKLLMEEELKNSGLSYTILRCSQFMDNIGSRFFPVANGKIKGFIAHDALVPYIACSDIGKIAATALVHLNLHHNTTIDLIGDLVSGKDLSNLFCRLESKKFVYRSVPAIILRLFVPEFYTMRKTFEKYGRAPHINTLQKSFEQSVSQLIEVTDFESFLKKRLERA